MLVTGLHRKVDFLTTYASLLLFHTIRNNDKKMGFFIQNIHFFYNTGTFSEAHI